MSQTPASAPSHPHRRQNRRAPWLYILFKPGDGEHKRLVDAVRMATYNTESALARLLAEHYPRARHEARSLLHETFATPADLQVIDRRLHVTLNPLSTPARTRAIAALCQQLTDTETLYPGSDLTLVYAVKNPANPA